MLGSSVDVFGWHRIVRGHAIAGLTNSSRRIGQVFPRISRKPLGNIAWSVIAVNSKGLRKCLVRFASQLSAAVSEV
jgi:hypothetical protein